MADPVEPDAALGEHQHPRELGCRRQPHQHRARPHRIRPTIADDQHDGGDQRGDRRHHQHPLGLQAIGDGARQHATDREADPEHGGEPRRPQLAEVDRLAVGLDPAGEPDLEPDVHEEERRQQRQQRSRGGGVFGSCRRRLRGRRDGHRPCRQTEASDGGGDAGDVEADMHHQWRQQGAEAEAQMEQVHGAPGSDAELPQQQRVGTEVGARGAEPDDHEHAEQPRQPVEDRKQTEPDGEHHQRTGVDAVTVETVVETAGRQRSDDVPDTLACEQHADPADAGARPLTQFGQGWPEHAQRHADDEEAGEVQPDARRPARVGGGARPELSERRHAHRRSRPQVRRGRCQVALDGVVASVAAARRRRSGQRNSYVGTRRA